MLLRVYPDNPAPRHIKLIVDTLKNGGVIIYPTDSVYAFGCDLNNRQAADKLRQLAGKDEKEMNLSFICHDLSNISEYTKPFGNNVFKLMKSLLPGPYTFILNANNKVPKLFKNSKSEVGIRVPDNNIPRQIVEELGNPMLTTSLKLDNGEEEYLTDPSLIYEKYGNQVDLVVDGGAGDKEPTTVLDCTGGEILVEREGKGEVQHLM